MANGDKIDVLLMTGIGSTSQQKQLFVSGYGEGKIEAVSGYQPTELTKFLSLIKQNPDTPVVLYSYAGKYSIEVAQAMGDKSKLFVIEPWVGNSSRLQIAIDTIALGVPSTNFQVAIVPPGEDSRGDGIPGASLTPSGVDHSPSLTYAGTIIRSKFPPSPPPSKKLPITGNVFEVVTTGTDINETQKEGLGGANCKVIRGTSADSEWDGKTGFVTQYDPAGEIQTELPISTGTYQFVFTFIGYEEKTIVKQILNTTTVVELGEVEMKQAQELLEAANIVEVSFEIIGKVVDEETNKPISEATIIIPKSVLPRQNITDSQIGNLITPGDVIDAQDAGIVPDGSYTLQDNEVISQNRDIYEWLKSKNDPRFSDTTLVAEEDIDKEVTIIASEIKTTTQPNGEFITSGFVRNNPKLPPPTGDTPAVYNFEIEISAENYNSVTISPVNADGSIKKSIGIIALTPLVVNIEEEIMETENYNETQQGLLKGENKKGFLTALLEKLLKQLKTLLLPIVVEMIAQFGISQLQKLLKKENITPSDLLSQGLSCPADREGLNKIIQRKNKLTKQLNDLYKGINMINKFLNPIDKLINTVDDAIPIADGALIALAFIPSTAVTPIPSGAFPKLNDALKFLKKQINIQKPKLQLGFFQLNFLLAELEKAIKLLSILDMLVEICAEEFSESNETTPSTTEENNLLAMQTDISTQLQLSTQEQSEQLSPIVTNVNGFEMSVITVDNVTIGGLNRRRAIAKDKFGVTVLQGEPSFSSNDQILIDELVFYIQQNDLKAE